MHAGQGQGKLFSSVQTKFQLFFFAINFSNA